MKAFYLTGVLLFWNTILYGQGEKLFDITENFQDCVSMKTTSSVKVKDSAFFEDERYLVKATCHGEFGGSIWFKDKTTGVTYSRESTCPVCIIKLKGKYYVTNALAHLSGFSQVLEIDRPDSMSVVKPGTIASENSAAYNRESHSFKGARVLVDSIGILTLASFPYQGELFYIITDFQKTYVARIAQDRFVTLDTVSNVSIWTYRSVVIRTIEDHYVVFFANDDTKGYMDIFENKISLYRYRGH